MYIPVEKLVDGCMHTLREDVLPAVESRFARGQLWAVLDVLQNLRDRVEERGELHTAEADSAAAALTHFAEALATAGHGDLAERTAAALAAAPREPAAARSAALRATLVRAVEILHELPGEHAAAHAALAAHLGPQALRDLAVLKPSLLNEISKG